MEKLSMNSPILDDSGMSKKQSAAKEVWRRLKKNKSAMLGLIIFCTITVACLTVPLYIDSSLVTKQDVVHRFAKFSSEHIIGTDLYGRDLLTRILYGGRTSLVIGITAALGAMLIGGTLGMITGYIGGRFDLIFMRFIDVFAAVPTILLSLVVVSSLGASLRNLLIAITIARIPSFVRVTRSSVLTVADMEYIEAVRAGGARIPRIMFRHILPNILGTLFVQTTMSIANLLLTAASLSFLGLGVPAPTPEWGLMLSEAREYLADQPLQMVFPGVCIVLTTMSINLLGDGLRDAFDPRLRN